MQSWRRLTFIATVTSILCIAIAVDTSPYLRGPAPYFPDWRWTYAPANTLHKLWAPLLCVLSIASVAYLAEKYHPYHRKHGVFWLVSVLVLLGFLLQLSLLYYSQAGINVLVHRILNPEINGYFTTALSIQSVPTFLREFNANLGGYPMYAKFHPPAADLIFVPLLHLCQVFSSHLSFLNAIHPTHADVATMWSALLAYQKAAALLSGVAITLLANLALIPLYFSAKLLYGPRVAIRSVLLFLFVPSMLLFTPLNDVFHPLLTLTFLSCFLYGISHANRLTIFAAGVLFCISIYFTLAFLPLLLFVFLFSLFHARAKAWPLSAAINVCLFFLLGCLIVPVALFLGFGLNSLEMVQKIMVYHEAAQHARGYFTWLFYNVYDFLLFLGIPLALLYCGMLYTSTKALLAKRRGYFKRVDGLFLAFTITLLIVDLSGSSRGETARIWTAYLPIVILFLANFVTKDLMLTKWQFIVLLLLQAGQVILFQSVLVTIS